MKTGVPVSNTHILSEESFILRTMQYVHLEKILSLSSLKLDHRHNMY